MNVPGLGLDRVAVRALRVMRVGMGVAVRMSVVVRIGRAVRMSMVMRMVVPGKRFTWFCRQPTLQNPHPRAGDSASIHPLDAKAGPQIQRRHRLLQHLGGNSGINQRA